VVVGATNIAQARQLMVSAKPDLVLLDIMLPMVRHRLLPRALRFDAHAVIMVTAAPVKSMSCWDSRSAPRLLTKPFRLRELIARIAPCCDGHLQHRRGGRYLRDCALTSCDEP